MTCELERLAGRIRNGLDTLNVVLQRVQDGWARSQQADVTQSVVFQHRRLLPADGIVRRYDRKRIARAAHFLVDSAREEPHGLL